MKAQYSLEFLITYSWAFFLILAGLAALFWTGVLNINSMLPDSCQLYGQVECVDYLATQTPAEVKFTVLNNFGVDLIINNATIRDATDLACTPQGLPLVWPANAQVQLNLTGCSGTSLTTNTRLDAAIGFSFYRNSTCPDANSPACVYTNAGRLAITVN